jgi:hypothetical protein
MAYDMAEARRFLGDPPATDIQPSLSDMISRRVFVILTGAALLAGCVSTHQQQHSLSLDLVQSFKFAGIEGRVDPALRGSWLSMKEDFLKSKGIAIPQPDYANPGGQPKEPEFSADELRVFLGREFAERLKKAFAGSMAQEMKGTRPVRIVATLHFVDIPPLGARVMRSLLGGQSGNENTIIVSCDIVDAKSGQSLLRSPRIIEKGIGGTPVVDMGPLTMKLTDPDPMVRMLISLQPKFSNWLFKRSGL